MIALFVIVVVAMSMSCIRGHTPEVACSPFDYQLQTLQTIVKLQSQMELFQTKMDQWQTMMDSKFEKYEQIDAERKNATERMFESVSTLKQETQQWAKGLEQELKAGQEKFKSDISTNTGITLSSFNSTMAVFIQEQAAINEKHRVAVSFTVHSPTGHLKKDIPMFSKTLMNLGGGYNNGTGRFRCPTSGLYLFTVTLLRVGSVSGTVRCRLHKNSVAITQAYSYGGTYDSASMTLFVQLSVGDYIDLSCFGWQYINTGYYTLYSGSLIRVD